MSWPSTITDFCEGESAKESGIRTGNSKVKEYRRKGEKGLRALTKFVIRSQQTASELQTATSKTASLLVLSPTL